MSLRRPFSDQPAPAQCEKCRNTEFDRNFGWAGAPDTFTCTRCGCTYYRKKEDLFSAVRRDVTRKAWKTQWKWLGYLFRNPDLVLTMVSWMIAVLALMSARRDASIVAMAWAWLFDSLVVTAAPVLTLLFVRRKTLGLGVIAGWRTAWGSTQKAALCMLAGSAILILVLILFRPAQ